MSIRPHAALLLLSLAASPLSAQQPTDLLPSVTPETCAPAPAKTLSASAWLDRAAARVLPPASGAHVFRYRLAQDTPLWNQSDRMYPPFVPSPATTVRWIDVTTGVIGWGPVERLPTHLQFASQMSSPDQAFIGRDTLAVVMAALQPAAATTRRMNPWAVLFDWRAHAADTRVVQRCVYHEFPRIVLERGGERLYLNEVDGVPVKLDRVEPETLWGQTTVSTVWMTWWNVRGGGLFPIATFRQYDGATEMTSRVLQNLVEALPADSAPRLDISAALSAPPPGVTVNQPISKRTDTVRVSDRTFLLASSFYTEAVTLQKDTVYLLDATTDEARAREDSVWIGTLFPGKHPVVVVATDLAWPHISGVRFWVARGATIVSHKESEGFLRRVIDRKWTLKPDALEQARATAKFRFRAVGDSLRLAGGDVVVHALRGQTTEGAIGVWIPGDKFLWAGDYVQGDPVSPYWYDVVQTVRAIGLQPLKVGAQHIKLTDWADIEKRMPR